MCRYFIYLLVSLFAFGIGVFIALSFNWNTEEKFILIQKGEKIETAVMRFPIQTETKQEDISIIPQDFNQINFDDLKINNINLDTSYSTVLKKFGKPLKRKKNWFDDCGGDIRMTLVYSGLEIQLLGDGKGKNFSVVAIDVSSPKWKFASNINVGSDIKEVQSKFGQPHSRTKESGLDRLWYGNGSGWTIFHFRDNKLVKVSWEYNFC